MLQQVTLKGLRILHSGFRIPDSGFQIPTFHKPYKNLADGRVEKTDPHSADYPTLSCLKPYKIQYETNYIYICISYIVLYVVYSFISDNISASSHRESFPFLSRSLTPRSISLIFSSSWQLSGSCGKFVMDLDEVSKKTKS